MTPAPGRATEPGALPRRSTGLLDETDKGDKPNGKETGTGKAGEAP